MDPSLDGTSQLGAPGDRRPNWPLAIVRGPAAIRAPQWWRLAALKIRAPDLVAAGWSFHLAAGYRAPTAPK